MARHAGALNNKNVSAPDVILDVDIKLAIAKRHDLQPSQGGVQDAADRQAECRIRTTRENDQFSGHGAPLACRGYQQENKLAGQGSNLRMPGSKPGALPLGDPPPLSRPPSDPQRPPFYKRCKAYETRLLVENTGGRSLLWSPWVFVSSTLVISCGAIWTQRPGRPHLCHRLDHSASAVIRQSLS